MASLSLTDITNSIKNPQICFCDPFLKKGVAEMFNGRPICFSGNYGAVFKFKCEGNTKAVRIWTKDLNVMPELPARAKLLSDKIHQLKNEYFLDFQFQEKGLLVSGTWTPIVIMDWCKGKNLKDAISCNLDNPKNIRKIARNFLDLINLFHKEGLSHGDLQHGNILIGEDFSIKLIDYDSLYIPCKEFDNKIEEIKGLPDYQHPNRMQNKYANSKVDYFSELIIYLSLIALSENPNLWKKYNIGKKDYSLLFDVNDFSDLKNCPMFNELEKLSKEVKDLLKILLHYLSLDDINKLDPFEKELVRISPPIIKSLYCINCGKPFYTANDKFCIHCGTKKV